jgi:8-oxo-dGTP pyrophosphatase MutT (NUDIX family)
MTHWNPTTRSFTSPVVPSREPVSKDSALAAAKRASASALSADPHALTPAQGGFGPRERGAAYGIVVHSPDRTRVVVREPANHFDDTHWTLPKGRPDPGEHPAEAALRESLEETGHQARITGMIPGGHAGRTSTTHYYLGESQAQHPHLVEWETASHRMMPWDEAERLVGTSPNPVARERDLAVLAAARRQLGQ